MVKCTCNRCDCKDTFDCLHKKNPDDYCKCCVDDSSLAEDGTLYHREDLMEAN